MAWYLGKIISGKKGSAVSEAVNDGNKHIFEKDPSKLVHYFDVNDVTFENSRPEQYEYDEIVWFTLVSSCGGRPFVSAIKKIIFPVD